MWARASFPKEGPLPVEASTACPAPPCLLGFLPFTEDNGSPVGRLQASAQVGVLPGVHLPRTPGALSVECLRGGKNGAEVQQ